MEKQKYKLPGVNIEVEVRTFNDQKITCPSISGWDGFRLDKRILIFQNGTHVASFHHTAGAYAAPYEGSWDGLRLTEKFLNKKFIEINKEKLQGTTEIIPYEGIKLFLQNNNIIGLATYQRSNDKEIWKFYELKGG